MKKSLLALAALTAFAGAASAQSSVTLFGIVDLNAQQIKNGDSKMRKLGQDGINSSRLGVRGVEDLGGGLRAGFWLEGALAPDTGNAVSTTCSTVSATTNKPTCSTSGGQTWQRRSTVSLLGGFGEVRLGRDYTPSFWNYTIFDVFGTNGVGSSLNVGGLANGSGSTLVRANNTIGYFLPALGGVYGQLMVAAPEGSGSNRYMGGRIGYGAGPINVAAAYGKNTKNSTLADDIVDWNVGASYNFGFMTLTGYYAKSTTTAASGATFPLPPNSTGTAAVGTSKAIKQYNLGIAIPIGAGTIQATYNNADVDLASGTEKAKQYAFGYQYDLSKRTALYAHYAQIKNDPHLSFSVLGTPVASPALGSGQKSQGFEFGLRHSF